MRVGAPERAAQNRDLAPFRAELGCRHLGDRTDRDGRSNVEERERGQTYDTGAASATGFR